MFDCDFPVTETSMIPALRARGPKEGWKFVIGRYIASENSWKTITTQEWDDLHYFHQECASHGGYCLVWLIFEDGGKPRGAAVGSANAIAARRWISDLSMPVGGLITYTSDEDGPVLPVLAATKAFFDGLRLPDGSLIPTPGLYASGTVAAAAFDQGIIKVRYPTMSLGFSGTRQAIRTGAFEIDQILDVTYAGKDVDPDVLREGLTPWGIGAFIPGGDLYEPVVS